MKDKLEKLKAIKDRFELHNKVFAPDTNYLIDELERMYRKQEVLKRYIDNNN